RRAGTKIHFYALARAIDSVEFHRVGRGLLRQNLKHEAWSCSSLVQGQGSSPRDTPLRKMFGMHPEIALPQGGIIELSLQHKGPPCAFRERFQCGEPATRIVPQEAFLSQAS